VLTVSGLACDLWAPIGHIAFAARAAAIHSTESLAGSEITCE
jgi:hypothetical protein